MGKRLLLRMLPAAALVVLVAGAACAARSLREMRLTAGHVGDKIGRLRELQRIRDGNTADPEAVAALEALSARQPPDLAAMCRQLLPGVSPQLEEHPPVPAGDAWLLRQADLSIDYVALSQLADFLGRAEAERPPWRVRECLIEADPAAPGQGRVTLKLEALQKEER